MRFRKFKFGIFLLLFLLCGISAEAANCQLHVSLGKEGSQIKLSAYKLADAKEDTYEWLSEYDGIDVQLSELKKAKDIKEASEKTYDWIKDKKIQAEKSGLTNESGEIVFSVDTGAYLIAKESTEGEMAPVLVMIPDGYDSQSFAVAPKYSQTEKAEVLDKLESQNSVQDTTASAQKGKGAETGDSSNIALWVIIMAASITSAVFMAKSKRKKK